MKINGLEVKKPIEEQTIIYHCPYCNKRFLRKSSYYNHISKKYCWNYYVDFELKTKEYKENKITVQEYHEWVYEHGYCELVVITKEEKEQLSENFLKKIEDLYCYEDDV